MASSSRGRHRCKLASQAAVDSTKKPRMGASVRRARVTGQQLRKAALAVRWREPHFTPHLCTCRTERAG